MLRFIPLAPWSIWQPQAWPKQNILWLTPNQRLARFAEAHWQQQQQNIQAQPAIFALDVWLRSVYQHYCPSAWLPPWAEKQLFQSIVTSEYHPELRQIVQAEHWASQYQLDQQTVAETNNSQCQQHWSWCQQKQHYLSDNQLSNPALMWRWFLKQKKLKTSFQHIILVHFLQIEPPLHRLLQIFTDNCQVWQQPSKKNNRHWTVYISQSQQQQAEHLAQIVQQRSNIAPKKILIVVPDLQQQRSFLQRELLAELDQAQLLQANWSTKVSWNISGGLSLLELPQICTWLPWLKMIQPLWQRQDLVTQLRDPWLPGWQQEQQQRLELAHQIELKWPVRFLATAVIAKLQSKKDTIPHWLQLFTDIYQRWQHWQQDPVHEENWLARWLSVLQQLHWHSHLSAQAWDTQHYQMHQYLLSQHQQRQLLMRYLSRQSISVELWLKSYLNWLAELRLPIETTHDAPIQILGPLEAAGLPSELVYLWQASQQNWPSFQSRNLFLPQTWSVQNQLPHSSLARELTYTRQLQASFGGDTATCIAGFSNEIDGLKQNLSSIISEGIVVKIATNGKRMPDLAQMSTIVEANGRKIAVNSYLPGGVSALTHHYQCPFQSYALLQLNIHQVVPRHSGLSNFERGQIFHQALYYLLVDYCHTSLRPDTFQTKNFARAAQQALQAWHFWLDAIHPNYRAEWQNDLSCWLQQWWLWEQQRLPFVVKMVEQSFLLKFTKVQLKVRIDRLDQLSNGHTLLIDYKSSWQQKNWWQEPLAYPQLPIYALCLDPQPRALMIQSLNPDNLSNFGIANFSDQFCSTTVEDWSALLQSWQQQLSAAVEALLAGDAELSPRHGRQTCRSCQLSGLCRRFDQS